MLEPELIDRLIRIRRHHTADDDKDYVIDALDSLIRDLQDELKVNSHLSVQDPLRSPGEDKPADFTISVSGKFDRIKEVKLSGRPLDSAWDRINRGDYDEIKVIDVNMPSGRTIKTLMPIKHFSVAPLVIKLQTPGPEHPPGVHGYTPQKSNCPEYVEGQLQHFLIKPGTQGQKKPKGALGLGPY